MERQLITLFENINQNAFSITLALFRNSVEFVIPEYIKIVQLNKKGKIDLVFLCRLFFLLWKGSFDAVNSKIDGVNTYLMLICGILQKDNLIVEIRSSGKKMKRSYKTLKLFMKIFNHRKWIIVGNSKKAVNELQSHFQQRQNILYIGNGIDTRIFCNDNTPRDNDRFTLMFAGRVDPVKNIEVLISAVEYLDAGMWGNQKPILVKIVGAATDIPYFITLQNMISKKRCENKIEFLGLKENIVSLFNSIDCFILPSVQEGTSNSLLEAMACERICLVSRGADSDGLIEKEYVFQTNDYKELASKIIMISTMTIVERNRIGKRNRKIIDDNYSIQSLIDKYNKVWLECGHSV